MSSKASLESPPSSPQQPDETPNDVLRHSNRCYNIINENEVATLRTIFPDCDPMHIRSCLANEPAGDGHVRKVAEKLLATDYPKVTVAPSTAPTAPPLNFESETPPPSYEESTRNRSSQSPSLPNRQRASYEGLRNRSLHPPPLPNRPQRVSYEGSARSRSLQPPQLSNRHQRASSWDENGTSRFRSPQISQNLSRGVATTSTEVAETINSGIKSFFDAFKPATVERALHKCNYIWSRPIPSRFEYQPLSQQFKVLPKDKFSIQKGFGQNNYPSKELRSRDISDRDWHSFMNGLNSIIGAYSIRKHSDNIVGLKWFSWMNTTMDESLMETNITALNEYLSNWNNRFYIPRKMMVQLIDNKTQTNPLKKYEQYLLVKSI